METRSIRLGSTVLIANLVTSVRSLRPCLLSLVTPIPIQENRIPPVFARSLISPLTLSLIRVSLIRRVATPGPVPVVPPPFASAPQSVSPPITRRQIIVLSLEATTPL